MTPPAEHDEGLFAIAFRASPAAMAIVCAADYRLLELNDATLVLIGATREELIGRTAAELGIWADDRERQRYRELLARGGEIRDQPARIRRKNGDLREATISVERIVVAGEPCLLVVLADVTDVAVAERALAEAEAIGRVGRWSFDFRDGSLVWSSGMGRIFGRAQPPPTLESYIALVAEEDRERVRAIRERAMGNRGEYSLEYRIVRSDGELRWVHARGLVEVDAAGHPLRMAGTIRDITDERLHSEMFRKAFHASPVAMAIATMPDARIIDVNDASLAIIGRHRDEILGFTSRELALWADAAHHARIGAELASTGRVRGLESIARHADGTLREVVYAAEIVELDGGPCLLSVMIDVTEQRSAERRLAEAQAVGHVGSWSLDMQTGMLALSDEACRIAGVEASPIAMERWNALIHPDDRERVRIARERAMRDGSDFSAEYRFVLEGQTRWVHCTGRVEPDAHGPRWFVGMIQDVTERHEAEARLAASEERYRRMVETSAQGVLTTNPDGILTFANRRAAELLGMTPATLVGRNVDDFIAPEDIDDFHRARERRAAGLSETYDVTMLTAARDRVRVEVSATPLVDPAGRIEGALAMISDVTLRRHAEELRARLAAIVESSPDAITSCTPEGMILTWNAAAERVFGYSRAEAVGMAHERLIPEADLGKYAADQARVLRGEIVTGEAVRVRRDGTYVDLAVTSSPVLDRGAVIAISTTARDISAEKRLRASLRDAEEQIRQVQKMEAIGALAGGIAHDFNNILSVVMSSASFIEEACPPADPRAEDARAIREAGERAATLTRQLLAFSRRQVLAPLAVNLDSVVAGMEKMLRRLLGEQIALVILVGSGGDVLVDPTAFEQVILNLAVNARDAMPKGGKLTIAIDPVCVDTELVAGTGVQPGAYVRLRVSDTGIGMDDATRTRMFEPFFTTKPAGRGTGLGLSTVFGIVRQSNGFVRVDTRPGAGTTIDVYLPQSTPAEDAVQPAAAQATVPSRGETILLVEDEEGVRRIVEKILLREGYEVLVAANAGEALLICERRPKLDLLLSDVVMPIMNGRELAERLRKLYPGLRVVFMSGYHDDGPLRDMVGRSDVKYLQKPVPPRLLVARVRELLDA